MLFAQSMMQNSIIKLEKISSKLEYNKKNLEEEKTKLYAASIDLILACEEYKSASNDYTKSIIKFVLKALRELNNKISKSDDIAYIQEEIKTILDLFEPIDIKSHVYTSYKFDSFQQDIEIDFKVYTNIMKNNIIVNNRSVKIFQPRCEQGQALTASKVNDNFETYGIEDSDYYAKQAKENNTRILKGTFEGSRISNNVFDILIDNLKFKNDLEDNMIGGSLYKQEKRELNNIFRYLRDGGVAIFTIPLYRLYKDICLILSKQLEDVHIFTGSSEENNHQIVYIVGKKNPIKTPRTEVYDLLRASTDFSKINSAEEELKDVKYTLPDLALSLDIFKGSRIDEEELLDIAQNSGCIDEFFDNQKTEKLSETKKQPLLPFTIGQLGIVLTSGCLDGVIDEGDGHYHLVKGRVSKKIDRDRVVNENEVEETEIVSNRVEINILLPNGDFKTLT